MKKEALKAAFPCTLPVLTGYLFLGIAYGIYMTSQGFPFWYPLLISIFVYAGSMQFVAVTLLLSGFQPGYALFMTLMVNARHLFYGLAMLEKFKGTGWKKWYLIFAMSDETFSVNCGMEAPEGIDKGWFMFFISLLHQSYWVLASLAGALLGSAIPFNTQGIDFVMTALFVVIFLNQWLERKKHAPALIGVLASLGCLLVFGEEHFIIPAMACIFLLLSAGRKQMEREGDL